MNEDVFPASETAHSAGQSGGDPAAASSPLDAAAAKGTMHWPSDPDLDPEGSPEPLQVKDSNARETMTGFVGMRGFPPN